MAAMIRLELLKLRRTSLLWVGVASGMLAILVSFYLAAARPRKRFRLLPRLLGQEPLLV